MADIICKYSGILFKCEHLPFSVHTREVSHPLFSLPKHKLLSLAGQWSAGKLSHTEKYLLYLSLFHSTGLVRWSVPAQYHEKTQQIIANNLEQLLHIIGKIDSIQHPSFSLPEFSINPSTCDLTNSYYWIQVWNQAYNDWRDNVKSHANDQELTRRENSLNKLIKSSHKNIEDYPRILASWAALAGDFPDTKIKVHGKPTTISEYWQDIIVKCSSDVAIFQIPRGDLVEIIDHCEDNINVEEGTLYAVALMRYLRAGLKKHDNYLGLGDIDLASRTERTAYRILAPEASVEDANIQAMIDSAPDKEPQKKDYPDLISFVRAKGRWMMAQTYKKETQNPENRENDI